MSKDVQTVNLQKVNDFSKDSRKNKGFTRNNLQLLFLTLPVVIKIFIFSYIPMFGIIIAFKQFNYQKGILGSEWNGFKNFEFFFKSVDLFRITKNTILMNFLMIGTSSVICIAFGIFLFLVIRKFIVKAYQTVFLFPFFLSWVVVGFFSKAILGDTGIINSILQGVGLNPISFMTTPGFWWIIIPAFSVWKGLGYSALIYYSIFQSIDSNYFDAASIDGASTFQTVRYILLPFVVPMLVIGTIVSIGGIFRADFGLFYFVPGGFNALLYPVTDVIDTYVFRALMQLGDISMGAAVGVYQSVVGFILVIMANFFAKKYDNDFRLF